MRFRGLNVARWLIVVAATSATAEPAEQTAGEASPALLNASVEEMVVTGFRLGTLPAIPGPVSHVFFTDDFVGENKNLADLLSETEGINVRRLGGAGARSEVTIRGSSPEQVAFSLDGVRVNSLLTGGLNLSRVCLPLVDRVEVTSGAGTLVAGSGAIGGVVNIVTRAAASSETRVALTAGSFETYETSLLHSGVSNDLDYRFGYCGFSTQGDFKFARPITVIDGIPIGFEPDRATRVNNDREQHAGHWALGGKLLGGSLRFSNYTVYSSGGEPGADSANGLTAGQSTAARSRDLSNLAQLKWHRILKNAFFNDVQLMLYHRHESSNFRDPLRTAPGPNEVDTRLSMPGLTLALRHQAAPFGQESQLDLRLEAVHDSLRATNQSGR
ncbi:MAG: TonB-dependent receptor plug domain-containing protein, partial [Myxococcota bacterium]